MIAKIEEMLNNKEIHTREMGMAFKKSVLQFGILAILVGLLVACYRPPYNDFEPYRPKTMRKLLWELSNQDIQYIHYGDTYTLIVPTDRYFIFDSAVLNDICYPGLFNIVQLLKCFPHSMIYVAGFTDNIGSHHHKKMLSQARAEAMLTYLWANNIPAQMLNAEGYGALHPVGDNKLIHGSAHNRRLEIQWYTPGPQAFIRRGPFLGMTK